jgi:hypothetical protein
MSDNAVNPNTELWNAVCVTDPAAVKPITGKPYKGNSPKPYWLIWRATEVFGPCGQGWGVEVKSESFHRMTETDVMHSAVVVVWYMRDGKRCQVEQMGQTKACYQSKNGMVVDEDAGKKSVTDGMVKCLSMIGFAGDIFSGRWDDSSYVEWARQQYEEPDPEVIFADQLVQLHDEGNTMEAVRLWYAPESRAGVLSTNEAIERVWSQLRDYSSLRSAIKQNKPEAPKKPDLKAA